MTEYTEKELRKEALLAIRQDAKAAKIKARLLGYSLRVHDRGASLIAHGQRTDNTPNYYFDVTIAI